MSQYQNSLRDLLDDQITLPADLEPDTALHGFASIGASRVSLSARETEQFERVARDVAAEIFADEARRERLVGCDPEVTGCTSEFVRAFGRRAFRRRLSETEISRYESVVSEATRVLGSGWSGLEYAVSAMLQSPHFLYRAELGSPDDTDASRLRFDGYELASRLAFFLWNTTPDEALLDAAESGALATPEGLRAEAERLLASPRSRAAIEDFFSDLLNLPALSDLPQLPSEFPELTPSLTPSMREQTLLTLVDFATGDRDYREVFTDRRTYLNGELAALYGVQGVTGTGFQAVELAPDSPRAGLLGHASLLALHAHATSTSPTLRGKFVREVLLCQAIPPPPPDVITSLPEASESGPRTMREKLEAHASVEGCATCHKVMDPIGLALENFDAIGKFRTLDEGKPIDASGELDGAAFDDARGLGLALSQHPSVPECLARSLYRYAVGHMEGRGEEPVIAALTDQFGKEEYRIRSLLLGIVSSSGFKYAAPLAD